MEKGGGGGSYLGWAGLVGLMVGVAVGAALGYLEMIRRADMRDLSHRIHLLERETDYLRNTTSRLQNQIQAQEKKMEDVKPSPQYYDDDDDYYDDESYVDYRGGDDADGGGGGGGGVQETSSADNRTRRNLLEKLLEPSVSGARNRRAVGQRPDRYNLVISQGARRPPAPRGDEVKALVVIDPRNEHIRPPVLVQPFPSNHYGTTRKPRVLHPHRPSFQEHKVQEESLHAGDSCCSAIGAHFAANSTRFRHGHGGHRYDANHRMSHHRGMFKDWTPYAWSGDYTSNFQMEDGNLTVFMPGLYYIYAQIYYADAHDMSGFRIYINSEPLFQCSLTSISTNGKMKRNSCYTGGLAKLQNRDSVRLMEVEGERYSVFEHTKSFFGLFRVADI